jgi:hypothetical protein
MILHRHRSILPAGCIDPSFNKVDDRPCHAFRLVVMDHVAGIRDGEAFDVRDHGASPFHLVDW